MPSGNWQWLQKFQTGGKNSAMNEVLISIYKHMPHGNIDTVPGNLNLYT